MAAKQTGDALELKRAEEALAAAVKKVQMLKLEDAAKAEKKASLQTKPSKQAASVVNQDLRMLTQMGFESQRCFEAIKNTSSTEQIVYILSEKPATLHGNVPLEDQCLTPKTPSLLDTGFFLDSTMVAARSKVRLNHLVNKAALPPTQSLLKVPHSRRKSWWSKARRIRRRFQLLVSLGLLLEPVL
jgi:hypothetical protein